MEKKKLLYVGNKLKLKGHTATAIDVLAPKFVEEGFEVVSVSDKQIKAQRMLDMLHTVWKHRKTTSLVLIDTYSTLNFYYAYTIAKLCRRLNIAYIPILHGGNLPTRLQNSPKKSKALFEGASINVAPSFYLMEAFKKQGFTNLLHIPNTLEIGNYPFLLRKNLRPKLLWVRSFAEIYNPLLALDVLALLRKNGYDASLTMVGHAKDGSFDACKTRAEAQNLPVTFTGMLTKEAWIALAIQHDIFINTTNFDNTPVSVMEAMALGLPVVSTNVGGLPYLIENETDGLLVVPEDAVSFTAAIERLLSSPQESEAMALAARKKVEQFDWEVVKHQWISLLSQ
ncbi:glycosyltransferase family 4 protein [Rasiella sp. SM2506]|uniref:glycosyltransferase family 4 protein n=1 Tax=Rasiella sp. SM2506 TaxID=3423914 RepID=UPI003D78C4B4